MIYMNLIACDALIEWDSFLSGAVGALIGTGFGAILIHWLSRGSTRAVRKLAKSALDVFSDFAKNGQKYADAAKTFNNKFNIAQKRAVMVALHKVGLPIVIPEDGSFEYANVKFEKSTIDKDFVADMKNNIKKAYCDEYFYEDFSAYISKDARINAMRKIAVRYVNEVLAKSSLDENKNVHYPDNWLSKFSLGEKRTIYVLHKTVLDESYYAQGLPLDSQMQKLINEINVGIWDSVLQTDYIAYENMINQKNLADYMLQQIPQPPINITEQK